MTDLDTGRAVIVRVIPVNLISKQVLRPQLLRRNFTAVCVKVNYALPSESGKGTLYLTQLHIIMYDVAVRFNVPTNPHTNNYKGSCICIRNSMR